VRTDRLLLRGYEPSDADRLLDYYSNPQVVKHLLHGPWDKARASEQVARRIGETGIDDSSGAWAVVVERDGVVIGDVALWATEQSRRRGEVGWVFHPDHSGHGFATEAVGAVLRTAFDEFKMHRVVAQMDARNAASVRLCERLGMEREAHLRQDHWSKQEWADVVIYGLLASDVS
jgi:RimJ/RimL family protein N-acetyltransferase